MNWHIARDGTQLGTFNDQQIREALANGTILPTDLAWKEGMGDWEPVSAAVKADTPSGPPALPTASAPRHLAPEPALPKKRLSGCAIAAICVVPLFFILAILAGIAVPAFNQVSEKSRMMQASTSARMMIIALKNYAGDHDGKYPDADKTDQPQTSNDAFRLLVKAGLIEDETVVNIPNSPFHADGNIGKAPDFKQAFAALENPWCMTKGLTDSSSGDAPLLFEAAPEAGWPPLWNADAAGQPVIGRTWKGGKIIIGRNDGSVAGEKLESTKGTSVGLPKDANGKDLFTKFAEQGEYLDVMR